MFSEIYTGAPEHVFFSMWADDTSFTDAMDEFIGKQSPGDDLLDDQDEVDIDPWMGGDWPWEDGFFSDILDEEGGEEANALTSIGMDMLDFIIDAEEQGMSDVVPVDLGAPIPQWMPPTDMPEILGVGEFDGPAFDYQDLWVSEGQDTTPVPNLEKEIIKAVFAEFLEGGEPVNVLAKKLVDQGVTWNEVAAWVNSENWDADVRDADYSPEDLINALENAYDLSEDGTTEALLDEATSIGTTDGITDGTTDKDEAEKVAYTETESLLDKAASLNDPYQAPSYSQQFSRVFDRMPGSQTFEIQNLKGRVFNEAQALYYVLQDWGEHAWIWGKKKEAPLTFQADSEEMAQEENRFATWVEFDYFGNPSETRYGPEFYKSVRDLRDGMLAVASESDEARRRRIDKQGELTSDDYNNSVNNFLFMGGDAQSDNRLATIVGMYNIRRGTDGWMKKRMMDYYRRELDGWLASGRTRQDFLKVFVRGDREDEDEGEDEDFFDYLGTSSTALEF
jgi:hypothetical protein